LHELAEIQREQGSTSCVGLYRRALTLAELLEDSQLTCDCVFNLGHAYKDLEGIRDLDQAEQCYRRSLDLTATEDRTACAQCLNQLGATAFARFDEARKTKRSAEECLGHLENAHQYDTRALEMTPPNAFRSLAMTHRNLGIVYSSRGQIAAATGHYQESIRYCEITGDRFEAGQARSCLAKTLAQARHFPDAHEWAQAALRDFQACESTDQEIIETLNLVQQIESDLRASARQS
jgi:tetratricopeptide (TPR) repeat protein